VLLTTVAVWRLHVTTCCCPQVQGDHLLLLALYQLWAAAGFSKEFVRSYGLDLRGMNFAKEVRKQLAGKAVWGVWGAWGAAWGCDARM
jgi:hypothetical protein